MNATIMRNVPLNINGVKCLVKQAQLVTLGYMHIEMCVPHRVGRKSHLSDYSKWHDYEWDSSDCDVYYCNTNTDIFHPWADGHDVVNFIKSTFKPIMAVNLKRGDKASKELLKIYC